MKLVTLAEFIAMPNGTVYQEFSPNILGPLSIKLAECNEADFFAATLTAETRTHPDWGMQEIIAAPGGSGRWGAFDEEAMFLIYEAADRERLAAWLIDPVAFIETDTDLVIIPIDERDDMPQRRRK